MGKKLIDFSDFVVLAVNYAITVSNNELVIFAQKCYFSTPLSMWVVYTYVRV